MVKKLKHFVKIIPGINQTRIESDVENNLKFYDRDSFFQDYSFTDEVDYENKTLAEKYTLKSGDVIINNSLQLATIVGKRNEGKIQTINFIKLDFQDDSLDKNYFLYLFNNYSGVRKQKERELQGASVIQRISAKALGEIEIPILNIKEQKKIGKTYIEMLKLQHKVSKYSELLEDFVDSVLEEKFKEIK